MNCCRRVVICLFALLGVLLSGVAATAQNGNYEHLLFQSIRRGDLGLLKDTLRRGTPPDVRADDGTTPLMVAALHGSGEMVELLLAHGADPRAANSRGVTALLWGARDGEKVRMLLARGADPNARSALDNTPLMVAAASPSGSAAVEQLVAQGADLTLRNKGGRTALYMAAGGGNIRSVRLLLARAREQNQLEKVVQEAGPTVAVAASNGFEEIVKVLLEHGADPNRPTGSRGHALNAALLAGNRSIARTLITHGTELDRRIQPGDDPTAVLAAYTELDDSSIVQLLHERGVDFAQANNDRQTALTWARMRGHRELIDALVKAGAAEGEMPKTPQMPGRAIDLHAGNPPQLITQAVQKSVDLLQLSSDTFLDVRGNCVSCHHQNLPSVALAWARDRGFRLRQESLDRMIERQVQSWKPRIERSYELDSPYPVPPRFLGYGMWGFGELGYRPDELTRAVSWYLAATQQPDGRWTPGMQRPPLGGDEILATMLALRALQLYPLAGRERETAERIERAEQWLERAEPRTHQQHAYRTLGLAWAGAEPDSLADEVSWLLESQRADGGWAQLPGLQSDAWATGQTLVVLHIAGGLPTDHPAYQRGIEMLLKTQFDDGSWFVQSRSWPFQPYFESSFPFGRDQWISAPATAWAVMALVLAVDPSDVARLNAAATHETPAAQVRPAPTEKEPLQLVPAARRAVDFAKDIKPLLVRSCWGCHGEKDPESNFSLTTRPTLIRGGDSELPAVVPGASHDSPLVRFAAGVVPEMEMPPLDSRAKYKPLSQEEVALLRAWIDQGAKWPADVTLGKDK